MQRRGAGVFLILAVVWMTLRTAAAPLDPPRLGPGFGIRFSGDGATNRVHTLERSTDLRQWRAAAVLHHAGWEFTDVLQENPDRSGFFRLQSRAIGPNDDGRNHVRLPADPFANEDPDLFSGAPAVRWIKFGIDLNEPERIWFQDSRRHLFHYDWARLRLAPFLGLTRQQFDAVTLRRPGRQAILGAVLIPGNPLLSEFGVQLVGQDEFTREEVAEVMRRVIASVQAPGGSRGFYVPTQEQAPMARREQHWLEERGIGVTGVDRWQSGDAVYSGGWAFGRIVYVPSARIAAAYTSGELRPKDILLTDAVPAEVPFVAGILTLTPATPNSHVAILAKTYGVPFGWSSDAALRQAIGSWSGRDVIVRMDEVRRTVSVLDATGQLDAGLRSELEGRKSVKPLQLTPKVRLGAYWTNTTHLKPADVRFVGGKAANYGLLRRILPTNSQPAIGITFDLWDDFMQQAVPGGRTLLEEIAVRLGSVTYPPPDVAAVTAQLASVRDLIRRTARFSPTQQTAIVGLLQESGLPVGRKLRFRSSTNVEDTDQFTGAGLYDSYSGCLTDDLDGDSAGPSACDPAEPEERGVFRAIQRVYASFYNDNAFLERRRLGVDESIVGMALLVHESFPDEDELANGVTTLDWEGGFGGAPSTSWRMVTQVGAESVTNPESTARPEVVEGYRFGNDYSLALRESSARVPLGASVLAWDSEYRSFGRLFNRVADAYAPLAGGRTSYSLDFEFKKSASRGWQIKQVRPLPKPAAPGTVTPVLVDQPIDLCVLQGEFGEVFGMHRLKSKWQVSLKPGLLTASNLQASLVRSATVTLSTSGGAVTWSNGPAFWPGRGFRRTSEGTLDWLETGTGATRRRIALETLVPTSLSAGSIPILTPADLTYRMQAEYGTPQVSMDWTGPTTTTLDQAHLVPCVPVTASSLPQERRITVGSNIRIVARFYWPEPPKGPTAGYTAPCIGWIGTTITGLTALPIELRTDAAQTYHPFHHNFSEEFLFEPELEPTLSATQRDELVAKNIRLLHVDWDQQTGSLRVVGWDGKLRNGP